MSEERVEIGRSPAWGVPTTPPLALTAYNRGLAGIERARREAGSNDLGEIVQRYRGDRFGFSARNLPVV